MASKSAQHEPEKAEVIEALLDTVDTTLDRVKVLYEQFFLGIQKQPPSHLHTDVERKLRELQQIQIRNTALRYRFATIQQKFGSYNNYWRRTLRQIENGTYARNLAKVGRQAALTGEDIPDEILAAMPKRMREQVKRDREAALAAKRRREQTSVDEEFGDELATPPANRTSGGAHLLTEDDGELDIDAFFAAMTSDEQTNPVATPPLPPAPFSDEAETDAHEAIPRHHAPAARQSAPVIPQTQPLPRPAPPNPAQRAAPPNPPQQRAVSPNPAAQQTQPRAASPNPAQPHAAAPNPMAQQTQPRVASPNPTAQQTQPIGTKPAPNPAPQQTQPHAASPNPAAQQTQPIATRPTPMPSRPGQPTPVTGAPMPARPGQPTPVAGVMPARPGQPTPVAGVPMPARPGPPTPVSGMPTARPDQPTPVAGTPRPAANTSAPTQAIPKIPDIPIPPSMQRPGAPTAAPSQVVRPLPVQPGSSINRAPVPVENMTGPFPREQPQPPQTQPLPRPPTPRPPQEQAVQPIKPIRPARVQTDPGVQPPKQGPPPGMTDADVNALYAKYVKAKEAVGEKAGPGSYGKLLQTINAQAPKIMEQYKAKGVDFQVVVKDNQVVIRAKPKP